MVRARLAPASLLLASRVVAFDPKTSSVPERRLGWGDDSAETMIGKLKNSDHILVLRIHKATNVDDEGELSWKSILEMGKTEADVYAEVAMNSAEVYRVAVGKKFKLEDEHTTKALREKSPNWDTTFFIPFGSESYLDFVIEVKNWETFKSDPVLLSANVNIQTIKIASSLQSEYWCGTSRSCNGKRHINVSLAKVSLEQASCIMGGLVDPEKCQPKE